MKRLVKTIPGPVAIDIVTVSLLSPEVVTSSRDCVYRAWQVLQAWEDAVVVDDDSFNEFVDVSLAGDLVVAFRDRHQGRAEADGQVVGVHHVFLAVLGQTGGKEKT